jgi:hypothetical protein
MKRLTTALSAAALSAVAAIPALALQNKDDADLIALKTQVWPDIYASNDADRLDAFLSDDFVLIAGGSVSSKAEEVDWMRNNEWDAPEDFVYEVEDIVYITHDAAIIYGRGLSTRETENGTPCRHSYISSNTVRRTEEGWKPVSSHVSDVNCEPIDG